MTAPDANCTDVDVQGTVSLLLQTQAGYDYFLPPAKRSLALESSYLDLDNRGRPPKHPRLDREDDGDLFRARQIQPSTLPRTNLYQATPRPFSDTIFSSSGNAVAMLKRAEDAGGTRTLKYARGRGNGHSKTSPNSTGRGSNDHSGSLVASHGEVGSIHHAAQLLSQVGIVELLEQDERPTFIVDLEDEDGTSSSRLNLLFANPALRAQSAALESVEGKSDDLTLIFATTPTHRDFKSWVLSNSNTPGASVKSATAFVFAGFTWRSFTVRNCLRVVHGDTDTSFMVANEKNSVPNLQQLLGPGSSSPRSAREIRPEAASYFDSAKIQGDQLGTHGRMSILYETSSNERSSESPREQYSPQYGGSPAANGDLGISDILISGQKTVFPVRLNGEESRTMNTVFPSEPGFFDWTRLPVTPALPLHIQFARSIDWGSTNLGRSTGFFSLYRHRIC
jgi:hypothetical protein